MRFVPFMKASSGEAWVFGRGLFWRWDPGGKRQWRWCGGSQVERRVIYRVKTTSFGGMVQLDLEDICVWMDERRAVALFGAVAASMAGLSRSMRQYLF